MGSLLTMACLPAIRMTPRARVTVTTIGRPSGMAATARLEREREGLQTAVTVPLTVLFVVHFFIITLTPIKLKFMIDRFKISRFPIPESLN